MGTLSTDDLFQQLKKDNLKYQDFKKANEDSFMDIDINSFWNEVIVESQMKKSDIINRADIGYTYFYDIIKGKKTPSRDTVIKLFIALGLGTERCQQALKLNNWAPLYPRIKRDSIIIYALEQHLTLEKTFYLLEENGEQLF